MYLCAEICIVLVTKLFSDVGMAGVATGNIVFLIWIAVCVWQIQALLQSRV